MEMQGTGEMAGSAKGLPGKHKGMSSIPRTHVTKASYWSMCLYPSAGEVETVRCLGFTGQPTYPTQ